MQRHGTGLGLVVAMHHGMQGITWVGGCQLFRLKPLGAGSATYVPLVLSAPKDAPRIPHIKPGAGVAAIPKPARPKDPVQGRHALAARLERRERAARDAGDP